MKKISFYPFTVLVFLLAALTGCESEPVIYSGNEYVMFSDSVHSMPVTPDTDKIFNVTVSTSKAFDQDRNYAVELVINKSNAIEGRHFDLVSNNVLIKAGELTGNVQIKGYYDNIVYGDSLAFTLRLLAPKETVWDLYGNETNISIIKCIPFSIDDYVGNLKMMATFPYGESVKTFYLKSEKLNDSTLIIRDAIVPKYDLKLRFKDNKINPFENGVTVTEQAAFVDSGVGQVFASTVSSAPSFHVSHLRVIGLYLSMYVPHIHEFGVFQYLLQWVPQSEVDAVENSTATPFMLKSEAFDLRTNNN